MHNDYISNIMSSSDCLILYVQEFSEENHAESSVYVLYDSHTGKYLVRGQKEEGHVPYSFNVRDTKSDSIVNFIDMILGGELCRITMYNHSDLPLTNEEITYEYLNDNLSNDSAIFGYRADKFSRSEFRKALEIIKDLFNIYN